MKNKIGFALKVGASLACAFSFSTAYAVPPAWFNPAWFNPAWFNPAWFNPAWFNPAWVNITPAAPTGVGASNSMALS